MQKLRVDDSDEPPSLPGWTSLSTVKFDSPGAFSESKRRAVEAFSAGQRVLSELLQCEHLMVLTGLGTSLCITNSDGRTLFPTMSGLWSAVKNEFGDHLDSIRKHVNQTADKNIEDLLSRCQMAIELMPVPNPGESPPSDISAFIKRAEEIIRRACRQDLSQVSTAPHEEFLRRITRRGPRRPRACLFTTNYDLCFEMAANRIGLTVIDGFSFSSSPQFNPEIFEYDITTAASYSKEPDFVPRLLRLFKLHGSVDWHYGDSVVEKKADTPNPVLIYPQSGKYAASYSPPFLEMMARFQGMLRQKNVGLLIVCCGLNDLHISEPVLSAVKANTSLRVVVCAPDLCDLDAQRLYSTSVAKGAAATNLVLRQFDQLIDNGDARLTFINCFFPDLVKLMPMLPVQTDHEQHETRLKALEAWVAKQKAEQEPGV